MNSKWEADYLKARDAADEANRADLTQKSSHGTCTVGNEPDEDGYVECDECGMMWPGENDA